MTRVSVSNEVLRWAIDRSGRSVDELTKRQLRVDEWIVGTRQPTLRQLENLAQKTRTPLGYFFLQEPPEERLPIPDFRTIGSKAPGRPSADLLETIYDMQRRQAWVRDYLVEVGQKELPFVASARQDEPIHTITAKMRRALKLKGGWAAEFGTWEKALGQFRRAMGDVGIFVVVNSIVGNNTYRRLDPSEFRGFVLVDEYAPLVFVNGSDARAAQMFTLAHELAHVLFGSSAVFDLRELQPADDPMERLCNRVAAEFLVSKREMRSEWRAVKHDPDRFQKLARRFKVSEIVAARRALDLKLIERDEFLAFYTHYQATERDVSDRQSGGDFYNNQNLRVGRRFFSLVDRAAKEGNLLYSEAYRLTGLYGSTFERYAENVDSGRLGE